MRYGSLWPTPTPARAFGWDGNLDHDAEKIEGVYGADEWEAAANKLPAVKTGDVTR